MDYDDNDEKMVADYLAQLSEMFERAGFSNIKTSDSKQAPGLDIHEMGGVRMGNDPKTSVVDKYNRAHDVKNLFIVDGSSLVTSGRGQPTMTIQALAFRAGENISRFATRREI